MAPQQFFNIFGVEGYRGRGTCKGPSKPCGRPPRCRAKQTFTIIHPRTREKIKGKACTRQDLQKEHAESKSKRRFAKYGRHRR